MPKTPQDHAARPAAAEPDAPAFRTGGLSHRKPTRFAWTAGTEARVALARSLDLPRIGSLSLTGEIRPEGRSDFRLEARLVATVTQSCVVTLAPVPAAVDEAVSRHFSADYAPPEGDEVELPEDDSAEPLPDMIDIADIAREALALALPLYPRAPGAELDEAVFAEPGIDPLRDDDLRPFAALSRLVPGREEPQG